MHYGFWEKGTINRQQAIENENNAVIQYGRIQKGDQVLDVGCGVGGTAIYIAKKMRAHVTGITLDPHQVQLAKLYARNSGVEKYTKFQVMDFMHLILPSNHFDVIYGIESVCYAYPKVTFLRGILRALKPGGRLVIMDGYATRKPKNEEESSILRQIEQHYVLAPVVTGEELEREMKMCGFTQVKKISKKKETGPSVRYFAKLASLVLPISSILNLFPNEHIRAIHRNSLATWNVAKSYEKNIGEYCVHVGVKPPR